MTQPTLAAGKAWTGEGGRERKQAHDETNGQGAGARTGDPRLTDVQLFIYLDFDATGEVEAFLRLQDQGWPSSPALVGRPQTAVLESAGWA